jgi:hypothetical protein
MDWNRNEQLNITRDKGFSPCSDKLNHRPILVISSMLKMLGRVSKERS